MIEKRKVRVFMKWIKKLGLTAVAACLLSVPVWAAGGDVTVSDSVGTVSGTAASYSAAVTNSGTGEAAPVLVLVWYEDGVLKDIQVSSQSLAPGASATLTASMSGAAVTDVTKITGFVWRDKISAVPVAVEEIERFGSNSTKIEGFRVAGLDASQIQVDAENKRIDLAIPLYQPDGSGVNDLTFDTTVVTESEKASVKIGETELDGAGVEKEAAVDYGAAKTVAVTAEEGTTEEYTLAVSRYLFEDFDENSVFSDEMLVGSGEKSGVWQSGTTNLAQGGAAQYFTTRWTGASGEYGESVSMGVLPITEAHKRDGSVMDPGESAAAGRAMRVSKTKGTGSDEGNSTLYFQVKGNQFRDAGEKVVIEYDLALDYTRVEKGTVGGMGGGVRYFGVDKYNLFDNTNVSTSKLTDVKNLAITQGGTLFTADGTSGKPNCPPDAWYHVKTVIEMPDRTAVTYINGKRLAAPFDVSELWTGEVLVSFQTAGFRGIDLWVDNIFVSYQ